MHDGAFGESLSFVLERCEEEEEFSRAASSPVKLMKRVRESEPDNAPNLVAEQLVAEVIHAKVVDVLEELVN